MEVRLPTINRSELLCKITLDQAHPPYISYTGAYIGNNLVITVAQCVTFSSTVLPFQPHQIQVGLGVNIDDDVMYTHDVSADYFS